MSDRAAPCFYYHCADLMITSVDVDSGTATGTDSGTPRDTGTAMDAGTSSTPPASSCGCSAPGLPARSGLVALLLAPLALLLSRARRRC